MLQKEEQRAQSQLEQKFHQQREQMFRHIEQEMTVTGPSSLGAVIRSERDTCKGVLGSRWGRCQCLGAGGKGLVSLVATSGPCSPINHICMAEQEGLL